jgi:hypothetical protein
MRTTTGIIAALVAVVALGSTESVACRGPGSERATLLEKLPRDAQREDIVAKVEVTEWLPLPRPLYNDPSLTNRVKARVIETIKGIGLRQIITIDTGGTSCDQVLTPKVVGQEAYIAGRFWIDQRGEIVFIGGHPKYPDEAVPVEKQ